MMQHMETTEHKIQQYELQILELQNDLEIQRSLANSWAELYKISYNNTNQALAIIDYWKGKYHAIIEAE